MSELLETQSVLCSDSANAQKDSKAKEPTNESHKEDFEALLKKAVQVK